jgi:hypothetical protein
MRILFIAPLLLLLPLTGQRSTPSRAEIGAMEEIIDQKLKRANLEAPYEVLGLTRGLYLDGYGVVFSAEVNLIPTPGISPFRPTISKEEITRIRSAKSRRLPDLRLLMRDTLLASAGSLDRVPQEEQIVLALHLFYNAWEDRSGLPSLITMQAKRRALLDVATNRVPPNALDTSIRTREE